MNAQVGTILVAEVDSSGAELLRFALRSEAYRILVVTDGDAALTALRSQACDLALIDIDMPGMGGLQLCREMKADPLLARIPVIFITALTDRSILVEAFTAGAVDYMIKPVLIEEIQSRVRAHLRQSRNEKHLREQLAMRELVFITLSHDLRGPIGTAAKFLERLARMTGMPAQAQKMAQMAADSIHQIYQLLEDMLTWAQAIGDKLPFNPDWLPFRELAQECLGHYRLKASSKGVELQLEVPEHLRVFADLNLLRTIMLNLLSNALKFTAAGGRVLIRVELAPGQAVIQVRNTGQGLPPDLIARLESSQPILSQPGTQGEKGTGMGLRICQEFAAHHGGQLSFGTLDDETCISLLLPQPADR